MIDIDYRRVCGALSGCCIRMTGWDLQSYVNLRLDCRSPLRFASLHQLNEKAHPFLAVVKIFSPTIKFTINIRFLCDLFNEGLFLQLAIIIVVSMDLSVSEFRIPALHFE
jgi:hypothetical protein